MSPYIRGNVMILKTMFDIDHTHDMVDRFGSKLVKIVTFIPQAF